MFFLLQIVTFIFEDRFQGHPHLNPPPSRGRKTPLHVEERVGVRGKGIYSSAFLLSP
jgi:hypothetical protein